MAFLPPARAQTPTTIVTSFGSASAADIVARLLAAELAGVPVSVALAWAAVRAVWAAGRLYQAARAHEGPPHR